MDKSAHLDIFVTIFVYIIGIVAAFGYTIFIVCGGFGLSATPVALIMSFVRRPTRLRANEFLDAKAIITKRSERLLEVGKKLMDAQESGASRSEDRKTYKEFQQATYTLENDWKTVHMSFFDGGGSIILHSLKLIVGIVCGLLSLLWILHIFLYMVVPPPYGPLNPFLNKVFTLLDRLSGDFPMFGALFYLVMTFYLLICVLSGTALLANAVPFISVHPLVYRDTMMSSILFNVGLFLFASVSVNQFAVEAFAGYARSTALNSMFGSLIRHLRGIYWIFFLATYLFLAFAFIGIPITAIFWKRRRNDFDKLLESGRLDFDNMTHE
ncbi:hypothetical protein AKO1_014756 [Acrasis kona]|uniref:Uncharacterized protein n=1 Tax=Acrasis kona TaxID=1008807 RepID=A0AAW2Z2U1_9EUKA